MQQKKMQGFKPLDKAAMKHVKGAAAAAPGLWVCTDEFSCFRDKVTCQRNCVRPDVCAWYRYCP